MDVRASVCLYGRTHTELREAENPNHMSQTDRHIDEGRVPRTDDQVQTEMVPLKKKKREKNVPFSSGTLGG